MRFVYNLKPSNQETAFQVLKTKPAFLHSDLTTHNLRLRSHLREEGFPFRHAYRHGQTPRLGSLAPGGKPGSVGPDPFTTQEAGNTDSLWNLPGFLLNVLVL